MYMASVTCLFIRNFIYSCVKPESCAFFGLPFLSLVY